MKIEKPPKFFKEICGNCGFTKGSHHGGNFYSEYYKMHVPYDYCPGHEGRMDWDKGAGTTFEPTGIYKEEQNDLSNTTSHSLEHPRFVKIR